MQNRTIKKEAVLLSSSTRTMRHVFVVIVVFSLFVLLHFFVVLFVLIDCFNVLFIVHLLKGSFQIGSLLQLNTLQSKMIKLKFM